MGRGNISVLCGVQVNLTTDSYEKIGTKVITPVTKTASESHDLLSSHQRADGKGVLIPVGDIS